MLYINELHVELKTFNLNIKAKIKPGLTLLLGQNGSGKSTFLTSLTGYYNALRHTRYDVKYNDESLSHTHYSYLPQETRRSILSVKDFVELTTDKESEELLKRFNLIHLKNMSTEDISGGEFKRAQFAQIMLEDKPIIFLDEIDQSLDVKFQKEIFQYLRDIQDKIIIASVHHLPLALKYANDVMIIKEGELKKLSSPNNIHASDLSEAFSTDIKIIEINGVRQIIL